MMHLPAGVATNPVVMRGLDPRIHPLSRFFTAMDRRVKPGDDELQFR